MGRLYNLISQMVQRGSRRAPTDYFGHPVPVHFTTDTGQRPQVKGADLSNNAIRDITMASNGSQIVASSTAKGFDFVVTNSQHIRKGAANKFQFLLDPGGQPYVFFDWVLFESPVPKFGTVAFDRAAKAAQAAGFDFISLLAAGGNGVKYQWKGTFNGYYSWARYGFDAALQPVILRSLQGHPKLDGCTTVGEIIAIDPSWWQNHGDGCYMTFDLNLGSSSWATLNRYLAEKGLK